MNIITRRLLMRKLQENFSISEMITETFWKATIQKFRVPETLTWVKRNDIQRPR